VHSTKLQHINLACHAIVEAVRKLKRPKLKRWLDHRLFGQPQISLVALDRLDMPYDLYTPP
jgi:hypothetical protein